MLLCASTHTAWLLWLLRPVHELHGLHSIWSYILEQQTWWETWWEVPVTGTGSRLPETGQCVLSSGSRFLSVPVSVSLVPAAGKRWNTFYFLPASRETCAVIGWEYLFTLQGKRRRVQFGYNCWRKTDEKVSRLIKLYKSEELPSRELDEIRTITALSLIVW